MSKILSIFSICLAVVLPSLTWAGNDDVYIRIGMIAQDFGYKEFDDRGVLLDREDGLLPGVSVEVGKHWQDVGGVFRFDVVDGVVDYDGQTQSGNPLKTETDERITNFEGLFQLKLKSFPSYNPKIVAGLGFREWRRNIRSSGFVSGLYEVYSWKYISLGGEVTFWRNGSLSAGIDARMLRPLQPSMLVEFNGFDEVRLDLGSRNSARINFPIRYIRSSGNEVILTPFWESWNLGRSDDEWLTVGGVPTMLLAHEPRSETSVIGIRVSVAL